MEPPEGAMENGFMPELGFSSKTRWAMAQMMGKSRSSIVGLRHLCAEKMPENGE
jgi:hypothetical protein